MKTLIQITQVSLAAALLAGCGNGLPGGMQSVPVKTYTQIERLARPAINEGLVLNNAYLNAYNSIPPSADTSAAAAPVVAQAIAVLTAVYNIGCIGFTVCSDPNNAGASTAAAAAGVHGSQFVPDVMRISVADVDTTATPGDPEVPNGGSDSRVGYKQCLNTAALGTTGTGPLLCGGRKLRDNVADFSLTYLAFGSGPGLAYLTQTNNPGSVAGGGMYYTVSNKVGFSLINGVTSPKIVAATAAGVPSGVLSDFPYVVLPY